MEVKEMTEFEVRSKMYQDVRNAIIESSSTEAVVKHYVKTYPHYASVLENDYLEDAASGFPSDDDLAAGSIPPEVQAEYDAFFGNRVLVAALCHKLAKIYPELLPVLRAEIQIENLDKSRIFAETTGVSL